jgi:hypothetical protein
MLIRFENSPQGQHHQEKECLTITLPILQDPYFDKVPATRLGRLVGKKTKKRLKAIPPGLSDHDSKVLTKVKRRAYRLDYCLFSFLGVRFGWSSAIAIIPVYAIPWKKLSLLLSSIIILTSLFSNSVGDALDTILAGLVFWSCRKVEGGIPIGLQAYMIFNIAFDFFIGLVPFVGDLADALYKCNTRNAILLEEHLRKAAQKEKRIARDTLDLSLPEEFDRFDEESLGDPPGYSMTENQTSSGGGGPSRPEPARVPPETRGGKGWFGGRSTEDDLERGVASIRQPPRIGRPKK